MSFKDKFKYFPTLETDRLRLRQLCDNDASEYLLINLDSEVFKYMGTGGGGPQTIDEVIKWIGTSNTRFYHNRSAFVWAIALKENDKAIGYIECTNFVKSTMADIAYYLSKEHWNQGIMSEAIKAVVNFGFSIVEFHRIQANVAVENIASIKTLIKSGFTNEGTLRDYIMGKEFRDVAMLSILKKEYQNT